MNVMIFVSDFFSLSLGTATLSYWLIYLFGGSFNQFKSFALISFGVAALLAGISCRSRQDDKSIDVSDWASPQPNMLGWAAAGIAAAAPMIGNDWLFWLALLLSSAILCWVARKGSPGNPIYAPRYVKTVPMRWLFLLAISAAVMTLISHRADADDEYYISIAVALLDQAEIPLKNIAIIHSAYALDSYQAIIAWISALCGVPLLQVYYLVAPAFIAFLSVFIAYRLFFELSPHRVMLTASIFVFVLICWGDLHRSPGNFAYVRLFQGKAVFFLAIAPLMLVYAIRIYKRADTVSSVLLTATLAAGIGATQTIVLIGPLFLITSGSLLLPRSFGLATTPLTDTMASRRLFSAFVRDIFFILPTTAPFLLSAAILVMVGQNPQGTPTGIVSSSAVAYTLGINFRGLLAFGCLLLLPYMVRSELRLPLAVFIGCILAVGLNPAIGNLLDWLNSAAAWRINWVIPFAPAIAIVFSRIPDVVFWRRSQWVRFIPLVLALIVFATLGRTTLSPLDDNTIEWPQPKLPKQDEMLLRGLGNISFPIVNRRVCITETRCY